jgi:short-subunit dehydrogenase
MKKVVIFGATGGLGNQISKKFEDYDVISLGSSDVDITNHIQVNEFFKNNPVDIVINFAGVNFDKFAHKLTPNDKYIINSQIDVNIKGSINIVSSCLPSMRVNNFGRIILISSVLAEKPVVSTSIYSGCKGFLDSFAKTIGLENANKNINTDFCDEDLKDLREMYGENLINDILDKTEPGVQCFWNGKEITNDSGYLSLEEHFDYCI